MVGAVKLLLRTQLEAFISLATCYAFDLHWGFTVAELEHNLVLIWTRILCNVCNIRIPFASLQIMLTGKAWVHI